MTAEEIAARYNKIPGFRLIDYHAVALPLWLITFDALVIAEKKLPVVDEFILRAVDRQVDTVTDLAGFLGLSEKLVVRRLGSLLGGDMLVSLPGSVAGEAVLKLTLKGREIVQDTARTPPRREKLTLAYDAIARQPISGRIARESLRNLYEIRQFGLFEIPALPKKTPDETELGRINYNTAFPKDSRNEQKIHQVLSAQKVGSPTRRYREGVMLIYAGASDAELITVRFFSVDGRPMPEVDRGFQTNHGLQYLSVREQLAQHRATLATSLLRDADYQAVVEFAKQSGHPESISESIAQEAKLSAAIEEKQQQIAAEEHKPGELAALKAEIEKLREEKHAVERVLESSQGRFLEPQEHVPLFEKAFKVASQRLLIISPWVYDSIMGPHFDQLEAMLKRGVEVYIGYGISETERDEKKARKGAATMAWFGAKSPLYPNLHAVRLGNTHAKVLLVDDKFVAVGSFNWMSFGGFDHTESGLKVVREELSTLLTVPTKIDEMFKRFRLRFDEKIAPPAAEPPALPPKSKLEEPMRLSPRMIAVHLGKKPFQVIAVAMARAPHSQIDTPLEDEVIEAVYAQFNVPVPSTLEIKLLREKA